MIVNKNVPLCVTHDLNSKLLTANVQQKTFTQKAKFIINHHIHIN